MAATPNSTSAREIHNYDYTVRDRAGKVVKGKLEADSTATVAAKLRSMGYAPVSITQVRNTGLSMEIKLPRLGAKVKLKELSVFSRQFATMITAGLSLLRALTVLESQTEGKELKKALGLVRSDVEAGVALSASLAKQADIFPPLLINMTKAGEVGGFLDAALVRVAENLEAEVKLRGKVKAAMTYPVVVFIMAILMTIGMLLFVVPTFVNMFASLGSELPFPTRVLVALSAFMKIAIVPLALVGVAFSAWWVRVKNKEEVRQRLDPIKLKIPVFGPLFAKISLSRFSRTLSTLISSGVPILQSLEIVRETTGNAVISNAVRDVQESVRRGETLSGPLANYPVFPGMVVQMMAVGEDAGALDEMLSKISDFYDQEVEATTASLTALIEPLMIAFLGAVVGSMIIALYLPIFKVFDAINGG
jgi:type IV pilus assembly protein PilC